MTSTLDFDTEAERDAFALGYDNGYEEGYENACDDPHSWSVKNSDDICINIGDCVRPKASDIRTSYRVVGLGDDTVFALFFDHEVGCFNARDVVPV